MRISIFALGLVGATSLFGQQYKSKFNWQDYCFKHGTSPVCADHDFAVKPVPKTAAGKNDAAPRSVVTNPLASAPRTVTPSVIVVGGVDWRFADPFADALVGFKVSELSASPLARSMITELGAKQGLAQADIQKIFNGLSGVDQVVLSARGNRIVVMVTGRAMDSLNLPAPESGLKAVSVSGNAMLVGHADAVDQAASRIASKGPPAELTQLANELQGRGEFWAVGSGGLAGPQAVSTGLRRFSMAVSIRDDLTSDMTFEFNGAPGPSTLRMWQTDLGPATVEGNAIHVRTSMAAEEVKQKFSQIGDSPLGKQLGALVEAARYLPVPDVAAAAQTKPIIYGLEGGPRVVNQTPIR